MPGAVTLNGSCTLQVALAAELIELRLMSHAVSGGNCCIQT